MGRLIILILMKNVKKKANSKFKINKKIMNDYLNKQQII